MPLTAGRVRCKCRNLWRLWIGRRKNKKEAAAVSDRETWYGDSRSFWFCKIGLPWTERSKCFGQGPACQAAPGNQTFGKPFVRWGLAAGIRERKRKPAVLYKNKKISLKFLLFLIAFGIRSKFPVNVLTVDRQTKKAML